MVRGRPHEAPSFLNPLCHKFMTYAISERPESLASALVRMKEIVIDAPNLVLYSAFIRNRPLLKDRVSYLLSPDTLTSRERLGWNKKWWRPVLAFWIVGAVMVATFGGNHEIGIRPVPLNASKGRFRCGSRDQVTHTIS